MKKFNYLIYPVFICCIACFSFGCSSSSSDDDDAGGEGLSLSLPSMLNYSVGEQGSIENDLLSASMGSLAISIVEGPDFPGQPAISMIGTYDTQTGATTLSGGSSMWIDTGEIYEDELFKKMMVKVPEGVVVSWVGEDNPTQGEFLIELRPGEGEDPDYGAILARVNPDVSAGEPGVDIFTLLNIDSALSYKDSFTWEEFEDLEDDETAEDYEKIASFCYGVWQTIFERVGNCFATVVLLHENSATLESAGSISSMPMGDPLPGSGTGTGDLSWTDSSANGEIGPDDDFTLTLTNVWEDDEYDDIDDLYNGDVLFSLMELNIDETRSLITSIGGDFVFEDLSIQETKDDVPVSGSVVTFNGGFNVRVYE